MGLCRLCMNHIHSGDLIEIFSEHGRRLNVCNTIIKYFSLEIFENDVKSTTICQQCWCRTLKFEQFQSSIEMAQEGFFNNSNDNKDVDSQLIDTSAGPDSLVFEDIDLLEHSISTVIESASCSDDDKRKCVDSLVVEDINPLEHSKSTVIESASCSDDNAGIDIELKSPIKTKKEDNKDVGSHLSHNTDVGSQLIDTSAGPHSSVVEDIDGGTDLVDTFSDIELETTITTKKTVNSSTEYDAMDEDVYYGNDQKRSVPTQRDADNARIRSVCKMICTICSKTFQTFDEVVRHYKTEHNTKGYVMCCNRKITRLIELLEHTDFHINPNAFQCHICKVSLSGRYPLQRHIIKTHKKELVLQRPYICEKCPYRFTSAALRDQHMSETHIEKQITCDYCDNTLEIFLTAAKLTEHNKRYHLSSNICDFCGKTFKTADQMNDHRNELHLGVIVPKVQCKRCSSWMTEKSYPRHLNQHNADLATCTVCDKVLKNKNSLRNHIRLVHCDRNHRCAVCGKTFSQTLSLREHVATHTGDDLYKCTYCTRTFKNSANMHSHRKNMHFKEWERDRGKRSSHLIESQN